MKSRMSWPAILAAGFVLGAFVSGNLAYVSKNALHMGYAGVLAVCGVAMAMLALRDR